uniref:Uncharacterized protein n=1 Tax=Rhizophora mucronata TaxID=61149 RepID=A0A2P2QA52_RHIMU
MDLLAWLWWFLFRQSFAEVFWQQGKEISVGSDVQRM